jgi:hypothetical protein
MPRLAPVINITFDMVFASPSAKTGVTIQLTSDLPDSGVKSAHIHLYTARFFLVLEQIRGNLNSYQ